MYLAIRNLLQDKVRLALSILGIALAVMLILFLLGLRAGFFQGSAQYLEHAPGSVVVLPPAVTSTAAGAGQLLPQETVDAIAGVDGVARATPVLLPLTILEFHGRKEAVKLAGYDATLGGGPWSLARGRTPQSDDEVVVDRVLADRHGITVGSTFAISERQLRVVGLSNGTSYVGGSMVFAGKPLVESLLQAPGAATLVLVTPAPGTKPSDLLARLGAVPGTNSLLKRTVIANDKQVLANMFDQILFVMIGAAFIVGVLVVGMVIYTATLERRGEYGILKAIGARNGALYRVVLVQALIAALFGTIVGAGLAFGLDRLMASLRPELLVVIAPAAIAGTLGAAVVMALAGAAIPARSVTRLAPAEVFRR